MPPPSVLVLYNNPVLPIDHPEAGSEHDILDTMADTVKVLVAAGFQVRQLAIDFDPQPLLEALRERRPDAVFNLFEGVPTRPGSEVAVASLLEWLNLPFTGCPALALALGQDKIRTKHLLTAAGLPTPRYRVVEELPVPLWDGGWPAIVKPALQDASVGIDQGSVVTSRGQLQDRVEYVLAKYGPPVLVEEFIGGREFHVNALEDFDSGPHRPIVVLPPAEIAFHDTNADRWPIYTFTAKWDEASDEYKACPLVAPVQLPADQTARLADLATRSFRLLGCRDYARIDLRMDSTGDFRILEVNPNPYLNSLALVRGLEATGRTHEQFLVGLTLNALARGGLTEAADLVTVPVGIVSSQ
jgi:D-alanine-D-alanine ligase